MGVKVEDKDTGWSRFVKGLDDLAKNPAGSVDVGFFTPEIAERAVHNEFGTKTIPERSFIRTTVDKNKKKYLKRMTKAAERIALDGIDPSKALIPTANQLRNDLINAIITLKSPPNAPSTILAKGSSNPLVDRGEMQRAIQIKTGGK